MTQGVGIVLGMFIYSTKRMEISLEMKERRSLEKFPIAGTRTNFDGNMISISRKLYLQRTSLEQTCKQKAFKKTMWKCPEIQDLNPKLALASDD